MKLTKGKIRKLYNKRNQTLKKYKNKKTSYEKKTFRNKKQLNLARKTLKRIAYEKPRGGANEVVPKDKSKGFFSFLGRKAKPIDPTKSTTLENAKPQAQVTEDIKTPAADIAITTTTDQPITTDTPVTPVTPVAVEPAITTTDQPITTDQPAITTTDQPAITTTDQPAVTTDQPAVTTDQPTTDQPAVTESVSITTDQPITDQPAITESVSTTTDTPVAVEPAITTDQPAVTESVSTTTDTPVAVEPAITESVSTTTDQPPTTAVEPTVKEDTKNIPSSEIPSSEITNSLSKVTNYFANVIADKVSQNISATNNGDKLQDGFVSVNKAAEKMASSGGKKYKKTKRFRLTHNKTRQQR